MYETGPSRRRRRAPAVGPLALGLVCFALALRALVLSEVMPGGGQPVGPDATDWVVALRQHLDLPPMGKVHRYPLVPWAGSLLARLGVAPVEALVLLQAVASSLLAGLTFLLGRDLAGHRTGLAAGAWVAAAPLVVLLGVSTSSYGTFPLWYTLVVGGLLGAFGRAGPWLAGAGAVLATATLHQGLLLCLVAAPAGLLRGRPRASLAVVLGAPLGLGLAFALDPGLEDPLGWMLRETVEYLGGNVAEEQAREDGTYATAFLLWVEQLRVGRLALLLGSLAATGQVLSGLVDPRRRRQALATGWLLAPLLPLVFLLASRHHLLHLLPLLAVTAAAGIAALLARLPGVARAPAALLGLALFGGSLVAQAPRTLEAAAAMAGAQARVADQVADFFETHDARVAMLVTGAWPRQPPALVVGGWAVPQGRVLLTVAGLSPRREEAVVAWLLDQEDVVGLYHSEAAAVPTDRAGLHLAPEGPAEAVGGRADLWLAPIAITLDPDRAPGGRGMPEGGPAPPPPLDGGPQPALAPSPPPPR